MQRQLGHANISQAMYSLSSLSARELGRCSTREGRPRSRRTQRRTAARSNREQRNHRTHNGTTYPGRRTEEPTVHLGLAAIVLVLASLIFVVIMVVFAGLFKEATQVTAALGSLFTLMGTVVGTYFGIKSTQDRVLPLVRLLHPLCRFVGRPLGALDSGT